MPGMSKGFHFWQPAPRLNNGPWLAGIRDKKQVPVTLKKQWKEKRGEGGESWTMTALGQTADRKSTCCQDLRHMSETCA